VISPARNPDTVSVKAHGTTSAATSRMWSRIRSSNSRWRSTSPFIQLFGFVLQPEFSQTEHGTETCGDACVIDPPVNIALLLFRDGPLKPGTRGSKITDFKKAPASDRRQRLNSVGALNPHSGLLRHQAAGLLGRCAIPAS
jgi:hypothetical protein